MVCPPKMVRLGSSRKTRGSVKYVRAAVDRSPAMRGVYRSRKNVRRVSMGAKAAAFRRGVPSCTKLYAASLVDPSGISSKGACLPAGFPMPSQKLRVFSRGFMATGTTGDGVIMWRPTLVSDQAATFSTIATSVGTAATLFSAFTLPVSTAISKIPYTSAQVTGGQVEGRLVSGCIRVRYAGTEDARSGVVSLFEDPDHIDVSGLSANTMSLFDSCGKQRVYGDGAWHQINWSGPCKQNEQEYVQTAFFTTGYVLAISINGTTSSTGVLAPASFEWECWENLEFLGRDVIGKTNNTLDPQGTSHVIGETKKIQSQSDPLNPNTGKSFLGKLFKPKPGGTFVGNLLQGAASGFHPLAGAAWGAVRGGVNSFYSNRR